MTGIVALPAHGEVFLDARGQGRTMRLTWHHESAVVVLSVWRGGTCVATVQLEAEDVPTLVDALMRGQAEGFRRLRSAR